MATDIESGLTPLESHSLIEIQAQPGCSTKELSDLLQVDASICTRIIQKFLKHGWIRFESHTSSARSKGIRLTQGGSALCRTLDAPANEVVSKLSKQLSAHDLDTLVEFLRNLADTEAIPTSARRKGEHEYRVQQRRVTRLFGLLGNKAWNTEFSSSEYQILATCCFATHGPRISELAELLALKSNSVVEVVTKLTEEKLLERHVDPVDSRASVIVCTKAGKTRFLSSEKIAAKCFVATLSKLSQAEIKALLMILSRFAGTSDPTLPVALPSLRLHEVTDEVQIARCRGFVARTFVINGDEHFIPADLLTSKHRVFEITRDGETVAVVGYQGDQSSSVASILAASKSLPSWSCVGILHTLREQFDLNVDFIPLVGSRLRAVMSPSRLGRLA